MDNRNTSPREERSAPESSDKRSSSLFYSTAGTDRVLGPPRWWRRRRIYAMAGGLGGLLAIFVLVKALLYYAGTANSVDRSQLTIATVKRGTFVRDVEADGKVVATVSPTMYAGATGTVTLKVHAGDAVRKGDTLAVIYSPNLAARLSQEEATLESLRVGWQGARLNAQMKLKKLQERYKQAQVDETTDQSAFDRSREAYKLGAYTKLQLLQAKDSLEKAQFALSQAKLNYDLQPKQNRFEIDSKRALFDRQQYLVADLQRRVNRLTIRSPVSGRVGQVRVANQATVTKNTPLLTVVDLSRLQVQIQVPESEAQDLAPGMRADLEGNGSHWPGSVSAVSPEVVDGEVVARVRFTGDKPEGLRENQRMSVRILIDRHKNALMVDRGTFMDEGGTGFVYVVHGDIAERQPVRLGDASIQKVEILGGLKPGDRVVVSGEGAFNGANRVILAH